MSDKEWRVHNPSGSKRVVVTKDLPGERWLEMLTRADCRVEVCMSPDILTTEEIVSALGESCDGAIGQLTEVWGETLFSSLRQAGGTAYSNYAVGFNNVDLEAAVRHGIPVGNTPGVLTETTAEMAVALTFACGRRVVEADRFMRQGRYQGWLPTLFLGNLFHGGTVGVIGTGRIGAAYARMMVEGFKMNLVYYSPHQNKALEDGIAAYSDFLVSRGQNPVTCRRLETIETLLPQADVVSIHTVLDNTTHHLMDAKRLALMKENAILVNTARGPVVDEAALVDHCRKHPGFRAGLDVYEDEPAMKPGLSDLDNVVIPPHIASGTIWTRSGMATLAACNVAALLSGYPVWGQADILPFLEGDAPKAAPSIVNAKELNLRYYQQ